MQPKAPQLPSGLLESALSAADLADEAVFGRVSAANADFGYASAARVRLDQLDLEKPSFVRVELPHSTWLDVRVHQGDLSNAQLTESELHRIVFDGSRMTGCSLGESELSDVTFQGCKLDLANFRQAKIKRALFENCDMKGADFSGATLERARFRNCTLDGVVFDRCTMSKVDLRGSSLAQLAGASGLKGATIDSLQLLDLAPLLASALGIEVRDGSAT